jgi:hypothetical protein
VRCLAGGLKIREEDHIAGIPARQTESGAGRFASFGLSASGAEGIDHLLCSDSVHMQPEELHDLEPTHSECRVQ